LAGDPQSPASRHRFVQEALGMLHVRTLAAAALAVALAAPAPGAEAPRAHALVGARIVVSPSKVVPAGTVVLRDGVIAAASADATAPPDARVWDGKGLTLYPGLIDAYTVRAVQEARDDKLQTGHPNRLVRAERDIAPHAVDEAAFKRLREAGFTTAVVAPKDGLFRGRSVLVALSPSSLERALLRRAVAQHVAVRPPAGNDDVYPESLMGAVALFRQILLDAAWQAEAQAGYARNGRQPRPALSPALEALAGAAAGKELVVFETNDVLDTLRGAALARELRLRAWIVGNGHEYERLAEVRATGLPHILPVAYPKPPKPAGNADPNIELAALRHWDRAPDDPKLMIASGLDVAFTTFGLDEPAKLHESLAKAIERGLTAEQALAALTTTPASLLGIADRAGTLEAGKMANLVEVDGDLFVEKPKIRAVWIDGERYEVKQAKPPEVDPAGTWNLTVLTAGGESIPAVLEIAGKTGAWHGSIAAMGQKVELASAEVSGKKLAVSFDGAGFGPPGTISFEIAIDGDSASGSGDAPSGAFEISGSRSPQPKEIAP
jgi:imidazolonepropionase-like amidohydrolase